MNSVNPMLVRSVITVSITIAKWVRFTLERDTITQVWVDLFHGILLLVILTTRNSRPIAFPYLGF